MNFDQVKTELLDRILSVDTMEYSLQDILNEIAAQSVILVLRSTWNAFFAGDWNLCRRHCKTLLNVIWEHLNTGHWKDVHLSWRRAFTIVSLFSAVAEFAMREGCTDLRAIIRICDMGLLMGAPLMNNVLARLADELHQIHSSAGQSHVDSNGQLVEEENAAKRSKIEQVGHDVLCLSGDCVTIERCPSLERFFNEFMSTGTPVIIQNCMDHWPSMCERRWSTDYLRSVAGCRLVPVELGSQYTDDAWSQTLITIDEFIDQYVERRSPPASGSHECIGYLAQHQLFDQIPRLRKDIAVPDYCALSANADGDSDNVDVNAWFGPAGTVSPLHRDAKHNLLSQIVGRKYVRLFEREATNKVYPFSSPLLETTSQVDVERPDLVRFPLFEGLKFKDCFLNEGDMLYIPALYWHFVRSLSVSFSVSFWWN